MFMFFFPIKFSDLLLTVGWNQLGLIRAKLFSLCVHYVFVPPAPAVFSLLVSWKNPTEFSALISFLLTTRGGNESSSQSHEEDLKEQIQGPTPVGVHLQSSQRGQKTAATMWCLNWLVIKMPGCIENCSNFYCGLNLSFRSVRLGWGV